MTEKKVKEVQTEKKISATAGMFDVLRRPIISEKSAKLAEANGLAFEIDPRAGKKEVANVLKLGWKFANMRKMLKGLESFSFY